jgi:hypothetical protein
MKGNTMTYLQNDHVKAVMADRLREAEYARLVREVKLANKANREPKPRRRRRFLRLRDPLRA